MANDPDEQESEKLDFPKVREEIDEDNDDQPDELSLDQLAEAYAEVLKDREAEDDEGADSEKDEYNKEEETEPDEAEISDEVLGAVASTLHRMPKGSGLGEEDEEDNAGCQISPESILEAILFIGCPPDVKMTSRKIAAVMRDVSPKEVTSLYKVLNKKYKSENAPYHIVSESGNLRMVLLEDDGDLVQVRDQFYGEIRHAKLNQGAIDVLAVVAYNQPITREAVDKVRLKPSGSHLNQMVRRELLQVETTNNSPKKKLYRTTDRFLELFNLACLDDLPQTSIVSDLEELTD